MESIIGKSAFLRAFRRRLGEDDAFMKSRLIALVLLSLWLLPVSVIVGCADTENITGDDADLFLFMPGLEDSNHEIDQIIEGTWVYEVGSWRPTDGLVPIAVLTYVKPRLGSVSVFTEDSVLPMPEQIRQAFADQPQIKVHIGESGQSTNHIGDLAYQHFALGPGMQCIFMRQFFGTGDDVDVVVGSNKAPLGDRLLEGWYCDAPQNSPLSQYTITKFFDGVGIKDWSMPH
jgi:hypothetical protein